MKKQILSGFAGILAVTLLLIPTVQAQATQNIVEIASGEGDLSTLVTAVTEADLVGTLSDSSANYTVFAPTNAAFDALPEGLLGELLANIPDLTSVLTYHVVDAEVFSGDLTDGQVIETLNGDTLTVRIEGSDVFINDAQVVTADVDATNGVVHIIDGVLVPDAIAASHSLANTSGEVSSFNQVYVLFGAVALGGAALLVAGIKKYKN